MYYFCNYHQKYQSSTAIKHDLKVNASFFLNTTNNFNTNEKTDSNNNNCITFKYYNPSREEDNSKHISTANLFESPLIAFLEENDAMINSNSTRDNLLNTNYYYQAVNLRENSNIENMSELTTNQKDSFLINTTQVNSQINVDELLKFYNFPSPNSKNKSSMLTRKHKRYLINPTHLSESVNDYKQITEIPNNPITFLTYLKYLKYKNINNLYIISAAKRK